MISTSYNKSIILVKCRYFGLYCTCCFYVGLILSYKQACYFKLEYQVKIVTLGKR